MTASQGRAQIIIGTFVDAPTPTALRVRESHLCVISETGRILHLSPFTPGQDEETALHGLPQEWKAFPRTNLSQSQFITPGFVDCHAHAAQFLGLGTRTNWSVFEWIEATLKNEAKCSDLDFARSIYTRLVPALLKKGSTTVQYFATNHVAPTKELARICGELGQRALIGKICADQHVPDYYAETKEESVRGTEDFIHWCFQQDFGRKGGEMELVQPVVTARATCSRELLQALGELVAKHDVHFQSHAADMPPSVMDELYPDLEGRRDVELFSTAKLLGRKTCLVHGLHLRDDEVQQMAAAGASVASCPYTAMLYFDGLAPLPRWSALGLTIGLGTDVAAGYCPSMTGVGRLATLADRAAQWAAPHDAGRIDWIFAFHLATAGGAATLVLDDKIGRFEVGMQFDALLVDVDVQGQVFDYMKGDAIQEHIERWWNTGDDRNLRKVWVQGRSILEGLAV